MIAQMPPGFFRGIDHRIFSSALQAGNDHAGFTPTWQIAHRQACQIGIVQSPIQTFQRGGALLLTDLKGARFLCYIDFERTLQLEQGRDDADDANRVAGGIRESGQQCLICRSVGGLERLLRGPEGGGIGGGA